MADKQGAGVGDMPIPLCLSETKLGSTRCTYHKGISDLQAHACRCSSNPIAESDTEKQLPPESEPDSEEAEDLPDFLDIPDGGRAAWLVVLGAWCVSFCSYGWINSAFTWTPNSK